MRALFFKKFGGVDQLQYGELPRPQLQANQVLVAIKACGLNFADIYRLRGDYHIEPHTPYINGYEGAGVIAEVGAAVTDYQAGQRVFFADVPLAQAEYVVAQPAQLIPLPDTVSFELAASIALQGLTADFLAHDLGRDQPGTTVFVHGLTGGVGQILAQMLTADGIHVIGVTGNEAKRQLALQQGAQQVFLRTTDWIQQAQAGAPISTVYDGIGSTLANSFKIVQPRGKVVFFGMAAGDPAPLDPVKLLSASKSLLTGDLWDYLNGNQARLKRSQRLFSYFQAGKIKLTPAQQFDLSAGREAYQALLNEHVGKIILTM
ncbi:zinc-binding dehydrogenase [Loigolactobacillus zhaoyuanensis]|uniref:Zinc-binding dehydrogenase n=1 Tax=Loigolactobacillus zhaoyuanensis TaxID=2486017 RepID=A0ABW8UE92_9LACO|nr:zinc-binding dehydrogenase [Loigolactobacillus zhaoyuanensis]